MSRLQKGLQEYLEPTERKFDELSEKGNWGSSHRRAENDAF